MDTLNLADIKLLDNTTISLDELNSLELNPNVYRIEHLGYSGLDIHKLWYDVILDDNSHINVYVK
jgi:hypothetical protein